MEKSDFPYKGERGTRYGVSSGNTLRNNWWLVTGENDLSHQYRHGTGLTVDKSYVSFPHNPMSLNKQKRWEKVENSEEKKDVVVVHRQGKRTLVNGKQVSRVTKQSTYAGMNAPFRPKKDVVVTTQQTNDLKTISRKARRREEARKESKEAECAFDKMLDEAQEFWHIDLPATDKDKHKQFGSNYGKSYNIKTGKERRVERKHNEKWDLFM